MKHSVPLLFAFAVFGLLVAFSAAAAEGARHGLAVCAATLAPSLFPFFVLSNLLSELGLPALFAGTVGRPLQKLFRISGGGVQAFILGLTGGYPLGAAVVGDLRRKKLVSRAEAERLLAFCNNSGPAFILGAAGGVFHSPAAGLLLYFTHVLGAVCAGLLMRTGAPADAEAPPVTAAPVPFGTAFPAAASRALSSTLAVCGYVVFFSALLGMLPLPDGMPSPIRALLTGVVELGSGIAALAGTAPTPEALACAAFLLGFGGLSVHAQTLSAVEGTDIKCVRHLVGRTLCGLISAGLAFGLSRWFL